MRSKKELLIASSKFAHEFKLRSWWHFGSSITAYLASVVLVCMPLPLWARFFASLISGLVIVRMFIIYHDFLHGAILRRSPIAKGVLFVYGMLVLSPTSVWKHSHDHHHHHNSRRSGANPGSFPMMTGEEYFHATPLVRWKYFLSRHWATILLGYLTVFLFGMTLKPFLSNPIRHLDAGLALFLHAGSIFVCSLFGWEYATLLVIVPLSVACGLGSYLFYAQHNFPSCQLLGREQWHHVNAALSSSSYIPMSMLMRWFTGNIGFHHVHHLNAKIPFYRLPEAMRGLSELQSPGTTTLRLRDMWQCLHLNVWDSETQRLVSYREAAKSLAR